MKKCTTRLGFLALLGLFTSFPGSIAVAQNDPSGGACAGLDPSSALFSTCIQAHSVKNRAEHLEEVGAGAKAIANAWAALDAALATYAELDTEGTGIVPGFDAPPLRLLAVAYIERNGNSVFNEGIDTLIAKITDDDRSGNVSIGDVITTLNYPTSLDGSSEAPFPSPQYRMISAVEATSADEIFVSSLTGLTGSEPAEYYFRFKDGPAIDPSCIVQAYRESIEPGPIYAVSNGTLSSFRDVIDGSGVAACFPLTDVIRVGYAAPSGGAKLLLQEENRSDGSFVDVHIAREGAGRPEGHD